MSHDRATEAIEAPLAGAREGRSSDKRLRPSFMGKLIWPMALVIGSVIAWSLVGGSSTADNKPKDTVEVETIRPAPRRPEPVFAPVPAPVIEEKKQEARAPLPSGEPAAPSVPQPKPSDPEEEQKRAAAEAAAREKKRREAPLLVPISTRVLQQSALGAGPAGAAPSGTPEASSAQTAAPAASTAASAAGDLRPRGGGNAFDELEDGALNGQRPASVTVRDTSRRGEHMIFEGKTIPAVLETAINSDLPGFVRAMVDENVYAETGRRILIPRMSRLVGVYGKRRVASGETRLLIAWNRVVLPDGKTIELQSFGGDSLGRAGMTGHVDTHFFERFGAALVISAFSIASNLIPEPAPRRSAGGGVLIISDTDARKESLGALERTVEKMLEGKENIAPTIHIPQGARVRVVVARDLDFGVPGQNR